MKYNSGLSPNAALFLIAHNLNPFSAVDKLPISIARKAYEFFAFTQGGAPS